MKNVQRTVLCLAIALSWSTWSPAMVHAAGGGADTVDLLTAGTTIVAVGIVVLPFWLVGELGTTIYYGGAWLTSSSLAGGGSGPQEAFLTEHRHELQAAIVLDSKGVLRDLCAVYLVPVEARARFAREIRRHRGVLEPALGAPSIKHQLPLIHATLLRARQVALMPKEEEP